MQMLINEGPADTPDGRVGRDAIQKDLDMLEEWANRNIMKFSKEKCKVLHLREKNTLKQQNRLGTDGLGGTSAKKDQGLRINSKLSVCRQGALAAKTDNVLGCITRSTTSGSKEEIIPLHLEHFRLHLEYPVQFLASQFRKDGNEVKKIQQRPMRILRRLKQWSYEKRLRNRAYSAWRRASFWRAERQLCNTCEEVLEETEPGCLQCCTAVG